MGEKRPCCTCKRCYCCCYCTFFLLILAIGLFAAIVAAKFVQPEVTVKKAQFTGFMVTPSQATFDMDLSIFIDNPNDWPIKATIQELNARLYSLDKKAADEIGVAYYLGMATLPKPVVVDVQSQTTFILPTKVTIKSNPESADLLSRLNRDCGLFASPKTTKVRVVLADTVATVAGMDVDLSKYEIPVEFLMPCE
mmetsp:Transcript_88561/g.253584  ORF Transcript_88561/g.253584 Transcript_88561/m.253584 type:complete len:195 (-) Transcript_88561:384-968(-)